MLGRSKGFECKLAFLKLVYSKCHQRIKKRLADFRYTVASLKPNVNFISAVGDFGASSIAYSARRLLALVHRSIFAWLDGVEFWQLLFADDVLEASLWMCSGPRLHACSFGSWR